MRLLECFCKSEIEWAQESVTEFIELHKIKETIWNPKHPVHYNKIKKQDVWEEMVNFEKILQANLRITTCQKP
jgi:hypothetical protein